MSCILEALAQPAVHWPCSHALLEENGWEGALMDSGGWAMLCGCCGAECWVWQGCLHPQLSSEREAAACLRVSPPGPSRARGRGAGGAAGLSGALLPFLLQPGTLRC